MKIKSFGLLLVAIFVMKYGTARSNNDTVVLKETYVYSVKKSDTLKLDKYYTDPIVGEPKPCMIFVFGGGFSSGQRDNRSYLDYYNFFARNGFVVVAIDYRLGLKALEKEKDLKTKEFIKIFENTIYMAVEDLFDATNFILGKSQEWNIDKETIIASGSSAGGVTVLQGAYEISSSSALSEKLPDNFNYAGIISFAGAIYSNNGKIKWKAEPAPIQMFHGDADSNVPYNKIKIFRYGFFGSKYITKRLKKDGFSYYFYSEENTDHVLAGSPMTDNRNEIMAFIDNYIMKKIPLQNKTTVKNMNKPKVKKNFKMKDYVKSNLNI